MGILALGTVGAAYATVASQGASLLAVPLPGQRAGWGGFPPPPLHAPPPAPGRHCQNWPAHGPSNGGGKPLLLRLSGHVQHIRRVCRRRGRHRLKVNTLVAMPCWSLGQAVTAMVGQNTGAGAMDRVRKITRTGLWCGLSSTLILLLLVHRFSLPILQLFGSDSPEVLSAGVLYFQICCGVNSLFYTAMYLLDSFAIGLGHAKVALVNALLDSFLLRLPVCWCLAFPLALGYPGLWIGQAISPLLPALIGGWFFHHTVGSFPTPHG